LTRNDSFRQQDGRNAISIVRIFSNKSNINEWVQVRGFCVENKIFRLFSFFALNFKQIHTRNKKKKFEKNALLVKKTFLIKYFFPNCRF
jgi:hypothetical protein